MRFTPGRCSLLPVNCKTWTLIPSPPLAQEAADDKHHMGGDRQAYDSTRIGQTVGDTTRDGHTGMLHQVETAATGIAQQSLACLRMLIGLTLEKNALSHIHNVVRGPWKSVDSLAAYV